MALRGIDLGSVAVLGDPEDLVGVVMHGLPFVTVGGDG
jgi:hypothetical protein